MKLLLTVDRLRAITQDCPTEKDIELSLRRHRIPYRYDTSNGYTAILVCCRSGPVRIIRTVSRSAPYIIRSAPAPAPAAWPFRCPVYHNDY